MKRGGKIWVSSMPVYIITSYIGAADPFETMEDE